MGSSAKIEKLHRETLRHENHRLEFLLYSTIRQYFESVFLFFTGYDSDSVWHPATGMVSRSPSYGHIDRPGCIPNPLTHLGYTLLCMTKKLKPPALVIWQRHPYSLVWSHKENLSRHYLPSESEVFFEKTDYNRLVPYKISRITCTQSFTATCFKILKKKSLAKTTQ